MTREEAAKEIIRVLQKPVTSTGVGTGGNRFEQALCLAVDALHSRWVKTADRLPTEPDDYPFIVYMEGWFENPYDAIRVWTAGEIRYIPEEVIAYMPLLPLPEVEE